MPKNKKIIISITLLFLLGIIWGSGYSIAKFAMTNGVPPLGYSFWQSIGPAVLLLLFSFGKSYALKFDTKHLRYYLVCGLIGIALPNTIMYYAASHLPAGILAVIVNTVPIMTFPIALMFKQEKFHWLRLLGILLGVSGILFILLPKTALPAPGMIPWAIITLLTPLCFASCAVFITANRPADSSSLSLAAGMLIASSIILTPVVILTGNFYAISLPLSLPELAVLLEIVLSSIGYVLFFKLLKIAGPVYYSLVGGIVALTGLMWGKIIFDEQLNWWNVAAVVLILAAIGLVTSKQKSRVTGVRPQPSMHSSTQQSYPTCGLKNPIRCRTRKVL